jgi:DNA polymerase II large subunit
MAGESHEAYCVKCKAKRAMSDAKQITMKNGRPAMQGKCPVCGTTLNRILAGKAV